MDGDRFAARAIERGVLVTPGRYFEDSRAIRIGFGGDRATLEGGLERLGEVLAEDV